MGPFIVEEVDLLGPAPAPTGGSLIDGVYDLTSYVFYEEFAVENFQDDFRQVLRVRNGGAAIDSFSSNENGPWERTYAVTEIEGTQMTVTVSCPSAFLGLTAVQGYSASPDELVLFVNHGTAVGVMTHTRRD